MIQGILQTLICENCIWHIFELFSVYVCVWHPQPPTPQVSWLRSQFPSLDIEVDGGVGPDTIHKCAEVKDANMTSYSNKYIKKQKQSCLTLCLFTFALGGG